MTEREAGVIEGLEIALALVRRRIETHAAYIEGIQEIISPSEEADVESRIEALRFVERQIVVAADRRKGLTK